MIRKQVYIEPRQDELLKRLARERGVTEAEIIREAIDLHATRPAFVRLDRSAWEAEKAFIERRIQAGPIEVRRCWRREDLHGR